MTEQAESAPTRRAVLDLLKRNGEQTVAQLGAALGVSGVAVRRHLEVLEHVGLVQQTTRPQGRGRPAYVYALTEVGHDLFPRNYHQLVAQLLEAATSELGPEAVERLFDHRQQELAELYVGRTKGRPLPELARALAAIQDENGYMADCSPAGNGRFVVSEHNCAIARVAGSWPTACAHELALFKQLAGPGVEVERVAHIQAGDPVCAYVLRAAGGNGLPEPPVAPGR
ncbi:MAG: helix-turn-helix transcriptional regulator [Actinomycetes bacterium]|jgi:predicted ArsR family transcriptional regulator